MTKNRFMVIVTVVSGSDSTKSVLQWSTVQNLHFTFLLFAMSNRSCLWSKHEFETV